jgi:hypothetical protein
MDMGRGFRGSLMDEHSARYGDRWGDVTALEAAFLHGLTRFPDSGRGQGIQQIRRQVRRWDGAITIRSGTARIGQVPEWDDTPPPILLPDSHDAVVLTRRVETRQLTSTDPRCRTPLDQPRSSASSSRNALGVSVRVA